MYAYKRKIRAESPTRLWSNAVQGKRSSLDLVLVVRLPNEGDAVSLFAKGMCFFDSDHESTLATVEPGEVVTLRLKSISTVTATCNRDTFVECMILAPVTTA